MRGKETSASSISDDVGITPAYAGKRSFFVRILLAATDHPRLCGEKFFKN